MSINAISMSSAMSSCGMTIDAEHQRIMSALRAYGIEPTGEKSVDKAKLQKVEAAKSNQNAQFSNSKDNAQKAESTDNNTIVDKGEGTDQMAMLNKLKLGLL